jgi:hypothetical protein
MPPGSEANHATDEIDPATPATPRRVVVRFWVAVTVVVFVATVGLLFWRWAINREPTSVIVVEGTPRFDGVDVQLRGPALPEPYAATLSARNDFRVPLFVDRGVYVLRLARADQTLLETEVIVGRREGRRFDLSQLESVLDARPTTTRANGD